MDYRSILWQNGACFDFSDDFNLPPPKKKLSLTVQQKRRSKHWTNYYSELICHPNPRFPGKKTLCSIITGAWKGEITKMQKGGEGEKLGSLSDRCGRLVIYHILLLLP